MLANGNGKVTVSSQCKLRLFIIIGSASIAKAFNFLLVVGTVTLLPPAPFGCGAFRGSPTNESYPCMRPLLRSRGGTVISRRLREKNPHLRPPNTSCLCNNFANIGDCPRIACDIMTKTKRKSYSSSGASPSRRSTTRIRATKADSDVEVDIGCPKKASPSSAPAYKMLMILSPAKTLNLDRDSDDLPVAWTQPLADLSGERAQVVAAIKGHAASATNLGKLLNTSAKITATARGYWQDMSGDAAGCGGAPRDGRAKPAIMAFDGAAYAGLNVRDDLAADAARLRYLQDHLRIVDPLYGWLRPLDAIEAYRLEMSTKGVFGNDPKVKLERHWQPGISRCLAADETSPSCVKENSNTPIIVVNLASDEYSAAVDRSMVKIVFKHGGRTIAVHAKRARGLMVRYATLHAIEDVDDLTGFDYEGYSYRPSESNYEIRGGARSLLTAAESNEGTETTTTPKVKKKKKEDLLTMVFDRPGTWKK